MAAGLSVDVRKAHGFHPTCGNPPSLDVWNNNGYRNKVRRKALRVEEVSTSG